MMRVLRRLAALLALGLIALSTPAWAQFDKYGHYNQNATEFAGVCADASGSSACGPIALLNSLVFLQNTYSSFGNTLVGDDVVATAKTISEFMGCTACGGTDTTKFFEGKKKYLEKVAPGKIASKKYDGPSVDDLKKEIGHKEDVELFIGYYDKDGKALPGHYVTLYAIDDKKLSFVDPGGVAGSDGGKIDGAIDEMLEYMFDNTLKQIVLKNYSGTPEGATARIEFAFAESPTPEPVVWAMLVVGFGIAGAGLRQRRRSSAAV